MPNSTPLLKVTPLLVLFVGLLQGCWQEASYCTRDIDCFQNEICENNQCVLTGDMSMADDSTDMSADQPPPGCPQNFPDLCGGACVNTQNDPTHCGQCDKACPGDKICREGQCVEQSGNCTQTGCEGLTWCNTETGKCEPGCERTDQCPPTQRCNVNRKICQCSDSKHLCTDGRCYLNDDPKACGDDCKVCPGADDGTAACVGGKCERKCPENTLQCGDQCSPCPQSPGIASTTCQGSQCVIEKCVDGYEPCPDGAGCCEARPDCDPTLIPNARGRVGDSDWSDTLTTTRFKDVQLDASRSEPRMGNYERKWELQTPPNSNTAVLRPSASANSPSFFVDAQGQYTATLTLYNTQNGLPSCTSSTVTVTIVRN